MRQPPPPHVFHNPHHSKKASKRKTLATMASTTFSSSSATKPTSFITLVLSSLFLCISSSSSSSISISSTGPSPPPAAIIPTPWPPQFHSKQIMNITGSLSIIDLWYDWPKGRNLNIIQSQLGGQPLHDLEWNNGTSFFYTLHDDDDNKNQQQHCRTAQLEVGILRPNWLEGAEYLGQEKVDGFVCNVWEKADFITYYEDVVTKRPVQWIFYTGRAVHVMTFEVGAVLEDEKCQAPVYCFHNEEEEEARSSQV